MKSLRSAMLFALFEGGSAGAADRGQYLFYNLERRLANLEAGR